jgi:membrane-bound serine protease (ClpP class)
MPSDLLFAGILLLMGLFLTFLEVAVIPGFGLIGVAGFVSYAAGIGVVWVNHGSMWGLVSILVSLPLFALVFWLVSKSGITKRLVLTKNAEGDSSDVPELTHLLGRTGMATTALRPSGLALIDGTRYDVVADGDFLEKGAPVRVSRISTNSILVSRLD